MRNQQKFSQIKPSRLNIRKILFRDWCHLVSALFWLKSANFGDKFQEGRLFAFHEIWSPLVNYALILAIKGKPGQCICSDSLESGFHITIENSILSVRLKSLYSKFKNFGAQTQNTSFMVQSCLNHPKHVTFLPWFPKRIRVSGLT